MAGPRGPVPKRSDQRRRQNADGWQPERVTVDEGAVAGPELALDDPHPLAAEWYEAMRRSGQSRFFEPSDWAQARIWTELLSRTLKQGVKPSAMLIAAWSSGAAELLTTEGARRRMRIELERGTAIDEDEDAAVTAIDHYRQRLSG